MYQFENWRSSAMRFAWFALPLPFFWRGKTKIPNSSHRIDRGSFCSPPLFGFKKRTAKPKPRHRSTRGVARPGQDRPCVTRPSKLTSDFRLPTSNHDEHSFDCRSTVVSHHDIVEETKQQSVEYSIRFYFIKLSLSFIMPNWKLDGCCGGSEEIVFLCLYGGYSLLTYFTMQMAIAKPLKLIAIFIHEMGQ
jgi:hypothetical protein